MKKPAPKRTTKAKRKAPQPIGKVIIETPAERHARDMAATEAIDRKVMAASALVRKKAKKATA